LFEHARTHKLGKAYLGTGFQIERHPDTVLAPAVAFVRADRVVNTPYFFDGPPDIAIEVASGDEDKSADWLHAGTPAVIVVDPTRQSVRIHRLGKIVNVTDTIDIDDVVPGWRLPLSEIFE